MDPRLDLAELGRKLHESLISGDPVATGQLAESFLPPLLTVLKRRFPTVDYQEIESEAHSSLVSYLTQPERFDPDRWTLLFYLRLDASRNILDLLRKRRKKVVALSISDNESLVAELVDELDPDLCWQGREVPAEIEEALAKLPPIDRRILMIIGEGERSTSAFAEILGIQDLDSAQQRVIVKQEKDRIKRKLRRELSKPKYRQYLKRVMRWTWRKRSET